ncbi:MAG: pilus assembly protein [Candidatus Methylomirabilales bacterium]
MRKALTLLVVALLIQAPGVARGDTDDLIVLGLKSNVLILMDGSGSMNDADGGKYDVSYGVDLNGDGNTECPGNECVSDLDVDGNDNTRNDVALKVVLDLLDANGDGLVDATDEAILGVRLGLMYYTSGGDSNKNDARPRAEIDYSFETIAPLGTPYAQIKQAIIGPVLAATPDPRIVVGSERGCGATPSQYSQDPAACGSGAEGSQTRWGYGLDDTPTAESLEYLEHYWFPAQFAADPDAVCRQNFILLITDGASDGFTAVPTVAASIYNNGAPKAHGLGVPPGFKDRNGTLIPVPSLTPEPEWFAKVFAVGFAGGDKKELEETAAAAGTGTAFFPDTVDGLTSAVQAAISTVQASTLSVASPAVPAARVGSSNALYLASFTPSSDNPFWQGELTAYPLQSDGTVQTDALGTITSLPLWEAHLVLKGIKEKDRNMKTVLPSTTALIDFDNGGSSYNDLRSALNVTQDVNGDGKVDKNDEDFLIEYVQGKAGDEKKKGAHPDWKLGDINHSSPVLIGPPSSSYVDLNLDRTIDTSFTTFHTIYATRDRVLYAGSNAGVLHAFHAGTWTGSDYNTGTGGERWAFVPPDLLPKLQDMVSNHTAYVDGPPKAADVWLDGNSDGLKAANEWHTVLVTGERRGGTAYFALDVTNPGTAASPNPPTYLWTFTDPNLGQTWSQAAIGKVRLSLNNGATTIDRWVAFVGGGYLPASDTSAVGKAFFVIDMNTGTKLWEYTVADDTGMGRMPAAPTAVDTDGDGFVDRVYVGDLNGNIWRFDLQAVGKTSGLGTLVTGWTGNKLFAASIGQPFYNKVAVAADPVGQLWVYSGTGDLNDLLNTSSQDRFYAIKEAYPRATGTPPATVPAVVTDADLADTSGVNTLNVNDPVFAGTLGWYLPLPNGGEKILTDPEVFAQVLLFTSFTPTAASCTSKGGLSTLYALFYVTGGGATDYDAFKAGTEGLSKTLATMAGLSSGPKISMPVRTSTGVSSGGDVVMFVCTSSELCGNPPPPQPGSLRSIDYWRDL